MAARHRPAPLSGFPELLPGDRVVERDVLATLTRTFELHGFADIETRAVEPLDVLLRKGEIDKEVYVVRRLHDDRAAGPDARGGADDALALHYDLTVPFARYVLENAGHLQFPFRRYQVQKAWRGERPQEGRYREFRQADVDVVDEGTLSAHHEAEVAAVMADALGRLPLPPLTMQVNNRKLVEGFYRGVGCARHRGGDARGRQARQDRPGRRACPARRRRRSERGAGVGVPGPGSDRHRRRVLRGPRRRPRGQRPPARRGGGRARRRRGGDRPAAARRLLARGRPEGGPGPGLLHRHGLRDRRWPASSTWARSAPAAATTPSRTTGEPPTRVSACRSGSPGP